MCLFAGWPVAGQAEASVVGVVASRGRGAGVAHQAVVVAVGAHQSAQAWWVSSPPVH